MLYITLLRPGMPWYTQVDPGLPRRHKDRLLLILLSITNGTSPSGKGNHYMNQKVEQVINLSTKEGGAGKENHK